MWVVRFGLGLLWMLFRLDSHRFVNLEVVFSFFKVELVIGFKVYVCASGGAVWCVFSLGLLGRAVYGFGDCEF